jgi:primosomal protein N' (replication factor Y)
LLVPLPDIGLVMVASAHDRSLKSERAPRLHALVVAQRRAILAGAAFIASSASPPLEAVAGEGVVRLGAKRSVVKPETARPRKGPVTRRMLDVIASATDKGNNALVFVGRRGGALRLRCVDCAWAPTCPRCGTGLALVAVEKRMRCRVCAATASVPEECPSCRGMLSERGWGHDRVATAIERAGVEVPVVRVVRGDEVEVPRPSIVVGTLAAAHTIGRAGAIVVADLDQMLTRPDFRAAEYALQRLHELAGVLDDGGRFLVQTREPEHHVVQAFTRGSYKYFLERELPLRESTGYPPFGAVVRVELEQSALDDLRHELSGTGARVVGALPSKGKLDALVRGPELDPLLDPLRRFAATHARAKIDVDPVDVG